MLPPLIHAPWELGILIAVATEESRGCPAHSPHLSCSVLLRFNLSLELFCVETWQESSLEGGLHLQSQDLTLENGCSLGELKPPEPCLGWLLLLVPWCPLVLKSCRLLLGPCSSSPFKHFCLGFTYLDRRSFRVVSLDFSFLRFLTQGPGFLFWYCHVLL